MMEKTHPQTNDATLEDVVQYFASGEHCFVACDDIVVLNQLATSISESLAKERIEVVDGRSVEDLKSFAEAIVECCDNLLNRVGCCFPRNPESLSECLVDTERCYLDKRQQGFLVINHIDCVIEMQKTFEIEGPFREIMQFYDDVAIAWLGSRDSIIAIHQSDRPFYLSHRIFWI
jgi:hypothetical protein